MTPTQGANIKPSSHGQTTIKSSGRMPLKSSWKSFFIP